jgi:Fe-Mn family superoxide dismutase
VADHPELQSKSPEELIRNLDAVPEEIRTALRNNLGGHVNHSWFWTWMKKGGGGAPTGSLAKAIDRDFGGFPAFQEKFSAAAMKVFGSGWAWLNVTPQGTLVIETTPNQDNPLMSGPNVPVMGIDVWEHAYYLKHQNVRADYVKDFFQVVNWDAARQRFDGHAKVA